MTRAVNAGHMHFVMKTLVWTVNMAEILLEIHKMCLRIQYSLSLPHGHVPIPAIGMIAIHAKRRRAIPDVGNVIGQSVQGVDDRVSRVNVAGKCILLALSKCHRVISSLYIPLHQNHLWR